MLLLIFRAGGAPYALDAARVVEVVPRVAIRPIPHAPGYVAGLLGYRGKVVPVIDFGVLIGGAASAPRLSTRIIVAEWTPREPPSRLLGIIAEDVNHVDRVDPGAVVSPAMEFETAPYLGAIFRLDEGLIQLIRVDKLISEPMQDALYGSSREPD